MSDEQFHAGVNAPAPLNLTVVASSCTTNACPTIYAGKGADTLIFQGYEVDPAGAGVRLAEGERLVEIPTDLLRQVAHLLE